MTSIRHFPATHPLPDWRNFGVMLRVLLGVNAMALAAALIQSPAPAGWVARYVEMAALVEPLLLLALGLLAALRDLLRRLPLARPDCRFVGFEHAPLPWVWARISCRHLPNVEIRFGNFWPRPLGDYALVYAFLSPHPMPRLWAKAKVEMKPGALLVSNSFAVPERMADSRIAVSDRAMTYFYVYRPAGMAV